MLFVKYGNTSNVLYDLFPFNFVNWDKMHDSRAEKVYFTLRTDGQVFFGQFSQYFKTIIN